MAEMSNNMQALVAGGFIAVIILGIIFAFTTKVKALKVFGTILLAVGGVSLIVFFGLALSGNKETAQPEKTAEEIVIEEATFDEIYRASKENKLRAERDYEGKWYRITAEVNGMATGGLLNATGGATLTMETKVDGRTVFFYAEFEKDQEEALLEINVGDTITFEGVCYIESAWQNCKLIEINPS